MAESPDADSHDDGAETAASLEHIGDDGAPKDPYAFIRAERDKDDRAYADYARKPSYVTDLLTAYETYEQLEQFEAGQFVQWKKLMKNRRFPIYGAPAVVLHKVDEPARVDADGDPIPEPEDIVLGFLDGEQAFITFAFPHQRFTAWE